MYRLSVGGAQHCTATPVTLACRQLHLGAHHQRFLQPALSQQQGAHLRRACSKYACITPHSNPQAFYLARTASDIPSDLTIPSLFIAIICEWTCSLDWLLDMLRLAVHLR